jgi:DNA repair exonuclease SbcCD ATPase subunit
MQIFAIKLNNFFRFGERNNTIVFDILPEYKDMQLDDLYDVIYKDPVKYIKDVRQKGITNLMAISGIMGGNPDFSNGTGKSTILEGICYALYDQIVRKTVGTDKIEKAGTIVATKLNDKYPENLRESYVEIIFEELGKIYILKRGKSFSKNHKSHSPILEFRCINDSNVDDFDSQAGHRQKDTNESILNVVQMSYDIFVNSVLFGQSDAGRFLTSTDSVRKEMLISLLRLEDIISGCLENVRKRKNTKDKEILGLNTQIDIIDSNLKFKLPIDKMEEQILALQGNIKTADDNIKGYNDNIEQLSKSDVIKQLEGIREEGKKAKENLNAQKEAKESQIVEWKNLYTESEKKEVTQNDKINSLIKKQEDIKNQIAKLDSEVKVFDLKSREEELKKVDKAREFKPKLIETVKTTQEEREKVIVNISIIKADNSRIVREINALQSQIKAVQGDEFTCDKCKSKVSRKHIEDEIKKNTDESQAHTTNLTVLEQKQKEIEEKLTKTQNNLDRANDYLIKENKIKGEIKDNESKQQKINELKKSQEEDHDKTLSEMRNELDNLRKQKEGYRTKMVTISEKYDTEIQKLQYQINQLASEFTSAKAATEQIENKIKTLRKSIEEVTQSKSSYDSKIGSFKQEIINIQQETIKLQSLKEKVVKEVAILNRLTMLDEIFGLEGIQTRIVQKYLPLLNVYIKEVMDVLTNGEMSVEIFINDKSKVDISIIGGTANNFVMISGGEKMLVRLATDIGLALLSFARCSQKPSIVCLDEVFDPLDVFHTESVFRLITKLQSKFDRVLVISHKANINDIIQHKILVEKDAGLFGMSKISSIT